MFNFNLKFDEVTLSVNSFITKIARRINTKNISCPKDIVRKNISPIHEIITIVTLNSIILTCSVFDGNNITIKKPIKKKTEPRFILNLNESEKNTMPKNINNNPINLY